MIIKKPKKLNVSELTEKKIGNLSRFAKDVKQRINDIKEMKVEGKIIQLSSRDVEGDKNTIKIKTLIDNVNWDVLVTLSSEEYHRAVQAHDGNKTVRITGVLEKRKTEYKVTELQSFFVQEQIASKNIDKNNNK